LVGLQFPSTCQGCPQLKKTPGTYSIDWECGKVYNEQTGCSIETRIKEHYWHIQLYRPDKSDMAEHNTILDHCIQFNDTNILVKKPRYMEPIIRDAIEIELHPDNMNREGRFLPEQVLEATHSNPE
jgi:hypothetical protein